MLEQNKIVGVVAEHDLADSALVELVRCCGYQAQLIDLEATASESAVRPKAVLVRRRTRIAQLAADRRCAGAAVALVVQAGSPEPSLCSATVIPADDQACASLERFLVAVLGTPEASGAVPVSRREREILTSYVLGGTVEEVAVRHFVAPSTVRTHYRRVTSRYTAAGRPVTNKSQLLLQMVADGWIRLGRGGFAPPDRESGAA